jgi:hypothetical protein
MRFAVGNTRARRFDRDFGLFAAAADASPECLAALAALVFGSCRPLQTTDRRQPPLDLTLGELMHGLRKPTLSNSIGIHRSPFL